MTCDAARTAIQNSLDGRLPHAERPALDAHLELCAACRREQDAQRRLARLTDRWMSRTVELSDPGSDFTAQVLSRLETRPAPSRRQVWLPLTAALLLLWALALVPGTGSSLSLPAQALLGLPAWLRSNLAALPGDALAVLRLPQAVLLPQAALMPALLLGAVLLNAGFCIHVRQRSVS